MIEYERVIFLDADIMPRSNLDYIFRLSHEEINGKTLLRPNLILATLGEPCNTAMFMVQPSLEKWNLLQGIINRQREEGKELPYPHFDRKRGWGHSFVKERDSWKAVKKSGRLWNYHASHSDQGLMYFYAKYAIQDVSIVIGDRLQNWVPGKDGKPEMVFDGNFKSELDASHLLIPALEMIQYDCTSDKKFKCMDPPYRDMVHFSGSDKPWQNGLKRNVKKGSWYPVARKWFEELGKLNDKHGMGLDIENWVEKHALQMKESPLGYLAMFWDHAALVHNETNITRLMELTGKAGAGDGTENGVGEYFTQMKESALGYLTWIWGNASR